MTLRRPKSRWRFSDIEENKLFDYPFAIIADVDYFLVNQVMIEDWCKSSVGYWRQRGVVIDFETTSDQLMFRMRWEDTTI